MRLWVQPEGAILCLDPCGELRLGLLDYLRHLLRALKCLFETRFPDGCRLAFLGQQVRDGVCLLVGAMRATLVLALGDEPERPAAVFDFLSEL